MELNVTQTKLELIQWLTGLQDVSVLEKLLELSRQKAEPYQLSRAEKESVLKGLEDLKNGNVVPHSEVRKIYEKWL
jgi:hypothetical protein